MRPFLTWLVLGAILFLCSCQESNYKAQIYRPATLNCDTQTQLSSAEPAMSYSSEIDTFGNDDFKLSFEEDLRLFRSKAEAAAKQKVQNATRLSANDLFRAISVINQPERSDIISLESVLFQSLCTH